MIENYCKKNMNGRIPAKEAIPDILCKAKQDFDAACGKAVTCAKQGKSTKEILLEIYYKNTPCYFQMRTMIMIQTQATTS